ncbi:hypothetical protein GUITHDRAFT_106261 [Guillardia theta CCMP2712]|uniref:Uncharacterized protein n=1 Tax=Guillardia theta (strain CCMP2712) TaxID=905079 RepID=L1JI27_GUITC|nr:hypothetical protein GUITHDRAFT_106257 [Guillardia theta CCMP2712]XP_005835163.1 hypothetical protein GUITHDRAFT_106259 [Guillardia theta CCMP2712]XP_005835164.1 hypothetical protein GUITHDRAFT_106261 [Guillardia theta CCMP2712]EKX48182.1 hypothetical protein GUITHDRAFT_106257 [Guillardia theta CCMP2712]EKX48183.1 hypothetical protein GUITHDRAFT_106259 [Guillardia theta CCMP2712]EKX48184.1 hypothetical protein GUITHDRAFT_106261 [Guillardia theta CCMP2712]|eukprot:XP_005835162.1 hypothetical protein GUITHDRAFT_106257 [Guillardia theta CCMP2712]
MFHDIVHFQSLSSCVGSASCGVGTSYDTDGIYFGATNISSANVAESWLADSESAVTFSMSGSNQGAYNNYAAINTFWSDTTAMDNLRGADITDHSIAGSFETIGANTAANNVRGGHTVHTASGNSVSYEQH